MNALLIDTEATGWVAAAMMLATFACRTALGMRLFGIAANMAFIAYGWQSHLMPVVLLHALVLPINALHALQAVRRAKTLSRNLVNGNDE